MTQEQIRAEFEAETAKTFPNMSFTGRINVWGNFAYDDDGLNMMLIGYKVAHARYANTSPTPAVPQVPDEYAQILEHGTPYVIQKNGMYYAHGNRGYVGRVLLAEIYTKEYAESHCDVIEECRAIPVTELLTGADEVQEYIDRLLVMRAAMLAAAQQGGE